MEKFKRYLIKNLRTTESQYEEIKHLIHTLKIKKGTILLKETEICDKAFFVCKGLLRSYTVDEMGKQHIIQFAPENWWIADRSSFYFDEASELYIDAIEDTEVIFIEKEFLKKAEIIFENFNSFNTLALQNNIRHLQKRINLLLCATAEKKYLFFTETHREIISRIPLQMIASFLGIAPESLSRVRKELCRKNQKYS
ncbi:Cyclic nucleotide-binding domain protein [compost metagenome]